MRRVPFVAQMEITECGAAALAMVLAYHRTWVPLADLRKTCEVSRDGANALSIVRAAREYGLRAQGVKLEPDRLGDLTLPAILHWNFRHFVVLERVVRGGAIIVDPSFGRRRVTDEKLHQSFTGVALTFEPTETLQRRKPPVFESLARYLLLVRRHRAAHAQVILAILLLQITGLVFPAMAQVLVDWIIVPRNASWLWGIAALMLGVVGARAVLLAVRSRTSQRLQIALDVGLMTDFVRHLLRLPLDFFHRRWPGDLLQRVESNTAVRQLVAQTLPMMLLDASLVIGYAALMLVYDVRLGMVVLAYLGARAVVLTWLRRDIRRVGMAEVAAQGREMAALVEPLSVIESVKAARGEGHLFSRWMGRVIERTNRRFERRMLETRVSAAALAVQGIGTAVIVFAGARAVFDGSVTTGVLVALLTIAATIVVPFEAILEAIYQIQFASASIRRIADVLDATPAQNGAVDPGVLRGAIAASGVSFAYGPGSPAVVDAVDLAIEPGEMIALVGRSGAGKSTLGRLLMGLDVPTAGEVRYDGAPLQTLDATRVRPQIGAVMQDSVLFAATIRENITLFDSSVTQDQIREAARLACIDEYIQSLPDGLETRVAEGGTNVSGGQRQRICLARALCRRPRILFLDEATSALDRETEAQVHRNLAALDCTRIVIAHRLETVAEADRIAVLDAGRIVECGTYAELLGQPGHFSALAASRGPGALLHG